MNVTQALAAVMQDVQSVAKQDRNQQQGFAFRGIDSVINVVGPRLRAHGVVIVPAAESITSDQYQTTKGAHMRNVVLRVGWNIYGPEGDSITAITYGEAADAGDKAVSKAHSVAYRICLLQTLCIPTDEPDPDQQAHERSTHRPEPPPEAPRVVAWRRLQEVGSQARPDLEPDQLREWLVNEANTRGLDGRQVGDLEQLADALSSKGGPF